MKCNKCGSELLPNDTFCGNCGNRIQISSNTNANEKLVTDEATPPLRKIDHCDSNTCSFGYDEKSSDRNDSYNRKKLKSWTSTVATALVTILFLLAIYTVFNFLLMKDIIHVSQYNILGEYKYALSDFLNLSVDEKNHSNASSSEPTSIPVESELMTTTKSSTNPPTRPSATEVTSSSVTTSDNVPLELQKYADGLVYEGKAYRITLEADDWYINYRSSPELIDISKSPNNILGKIKHGSEIYVEYIYKETWVVFYKDGRYVFSSMYASNNPSLSRLMEEA